MDRHYREGLPLLCIMQGALVASSACGLGTKTGALVGSYTVHGVLVENTCGQAALPTSNPLDFVVEIRQDAGVAYWIPNKAPQNTGTLSATGAFRFSMSQTQVIQGGASAQTLEPSDFLSGTADFDLKAKRTCALIQKQTVQGSLQRRLNNGAVNNLSGAQGTTTSDDLNAEHIIEVTPSAGSDCNAALAALGGNYLALPCDARYVLTGVLDTTGAVVENTNSSAGATAPAVGNQTDAATTP